MSYGSVLAALADPTRRTELERLREQPSSVGRIADTLPVSRPAVSQHLRVLKQAGLVSEKAEGTRRVGLLGTRYTMDGEFYRGRLADRHGLEVLLPGEADRALVNDVIYDELCRGRVEAASRAEFRRMVEEMVGRGAEGVILGCTEIGLLLEESDAPVPLFDTARIHAERAAAVALGLAGLP